MKSSSDVTAVVSLVVLESVKLLSVQEGLTAALLRIHQGHSSSLVCLSYEVQKMTQLIILWVSTKIGDA